MMHINCIVSLIKRVEKSKPCHFTLLFTHQKLRLCVKSQTFSASTKIIRQDCIESNNNVTNVNNYIKESCDTNEKMITNEYINHENLKSHVNNINPTFAEVCPAKYMKTNIKIIDTLYLMEEKTAEKFSNLIIDDLSKNMTYVAEANPGIGLLTEKLLNAGVTRIRAYESQECFFPALRQLQKKYSSRLDIIKGNLFKMSKLHYMDSHDQKGRVKSMFKDTKPVLWSDKTYMQVIGAVADFVFLKHLILCVIFQSCFMSNGRPCFYLAIPPSMWNIINCRQTNGRMHSRHILFQILFDFKYYGELNRLSFVPWQKEKLIKRQNYKKYDHQTLCVVKIEPKANLFTDVLKPTQLLPFWYFIKHHITSNKRRLIPELEKWIPGCGVRLIAKDYNIFTQFIDLKPCEVLDIYKEFESWPEYKTSLFLSSVNTYIQSMHQNITVKYTYDDILE
ncbi:hypothetical protein KPH14_002191 [Odynerus spinipes]|uniref:Dimethyladenosine transferase 2, mitochondrial n=1 Tax=Odynerus spinipes TaxID=1348599 RepID=A0AAD9VP98_9HYME|nr:hypothetical protein KPH14_002191 [Odynerus spinipes]